MFRLELALCQVPRFHPRAVDKLDPLKKLSRFFEAPVEDMVHVVVRVPPSGELQRRALR